MIKWASGCRVLLIELRPTRRPKETAAGQVHLKLLQSPWQRPNGTENGRRLRSNNPRGRRFIGRQWWHDAPMVKFLRENLEKSGCAIGDKFIKAIYCNTKVSGGYARGEGIRSGHLSGDCHFKRELLRGYLKVRGHGQECVRRRVMKSVTANPHCSEAAAKDAMEAVWDVCYNDTKPFDRAP
eukprot:XP_019080226.1 PREDICTED: mitochondrial inner membrane protease ATP23 isoform X3 [Vitis vinifera]